MKNYRPIVWTVAAMTIAALAGAPDIETEDQILASFERSFSHVAATAAPATRAAVEQDVLYELINKPLQSPGGSPVNNEVLLAGVNDD